MATTMDGVKKRPLFGNLPSQSDATLQLLLPPFTSRCPKTLRPPLVVQSRPAAPSAAGFVSPDGGSSRIEAAPCPIADAAAPSTPPGLGAAVSTLPYSLGRPPISPQKPRKGVQNGPLMERFGFRFTAEAMERVEAIRKNASPFRARLFPPLLPAQSPQHAGKTTLVLDVDETLVHASFHPRTGVEYNLALDLQTDGVSGTVFVAYRPGLRAFLRCVSEYFEVVAFTASRSVYSNMVLDALDPEGSFFSARLFREHCSEVSGAKVKDLSLLNRPLDRILIVDNSPHGYLFQPRNGVPIASWFSDPNDNALLELLPSLVRVANCDSVYPVLDALSAQYLTQNNDKFRTS